MKDRLFLSGIGIVSFLVLLTVGFILVVVGYFYQARKTMRLRRIKEINKRP